MADPRELGKSADDGEDARGSSQRPGADPRDGVSGAMPDGEPPRDRAGRGNIRGTLREMNRDAGGVGGGLANMTGGDGGCLRRVLPLIVLVAIVVVVLIILGTMG